MGIVTLTRDQSQNSIIRILLALDDDSKNLRELAVAAFIGERWAKAYVDELRRLKAVYIASWWRSGRSGCYSPVYALGNRKDAMRPRAMTGSEKTALYRKTVRADPDRADIYYAKQRAKERCLRAVKKPSNWTSTLWVK